MGEITHRVREGLLIVASLTACLLGSSPAPAQQTFFDTTGEYYIRPAPCWTTNMVFYDPVAFPYFEVNGYFFDANPFVTTRFMDGNTSMIMRSSRVPISGPAVLPDMSGTKVWTDARIYVRCFVREYVFGLMSVPYAVVASTFGTVEEQQQAGCGGSGYNEPVDYYAYQESEYDPYESTVSSTTDCGGIPVGGGGGGGGGSTWSGPGGTVCHEEWLIMEVSHDGGLTWEVVWQGWGAVCQ